MTYTEITETGAKPSAEECPSIVPDYRIILEIPTSAELVAAIKGEK